MPETKPAPKPGPFFWQNNALRAAFFQDWTRWCDIYAVPDAKRGKLFPDYMRKLTGKPTIEAWLNPGGTTALMDELKTLLKADYGKDDGEMPPELAAIIGPEPTPPIVPETVTEQAIEHTPATSLPETPNSPAATEEAVPGKGKESMTDKTIEIREKFNKTISGKDYLLVQGRVALFRLNHPGGTIRTEMLRLDGEIAVFKAEILVDSVLIASGHGMASLEGTSKIGGRFIEKAETAAIGRALALAGFGTDDTLDDSEWLSDSPIERRAA